MTKQITIDTSLPPFLHLQLSPLSHTAVAKDNISVPQPGQNLSISQFPLSLLWDQQILLAYGLLINVLCYPHHTIEIHIKAFICCLELLQHPFLWHLQIIIPSVQNAFTKGMCPISSFVSSVTFPMHSSTDLIIQHKVPVFITKDTPFLSTSHLSASSKRASFCSSLLWCLPPPVHKLLSDVLLQIFCWPNPPSQYQQEHFLLVL